MKNLFASLLFIVGTGFAHASISQIEDTISIDEILLLANAKVSDKTILLFIETNELGFVPTAAEIETLKKAGVGEKIIQRLLQKTTVSNDDSHDKSADSENKVAYVDPYPYYYYNPYYYSGASLYVGFDGFSHRWFTPHFTHATHHTGGRHSGGHNAGHNSTHSIAAYGSHILSAPNNGRHNQLQRKGKQHSTSNRHGSRAGNFSSGNSGAPHQSVERNRHSNNRQHAGSSNITAPHRGNGNAGGGGHLNSFFGGGHSGGGGRHGRSH